MFRNIVLLSIVALLSSLSSRADDEAARELEMTAIVSRGTLLMSKTSTNMVWRATASISVRNNSANPVSTIPFYFDSPSWTVSRVSFVDMPTPQTGHKLPKWGSGLFVELPSQLASGDTIEVQFTYELNISPSGGRSLFFDGTSPDFPALELINFSSPSAMVPVPGRVNGKTIERPKAFGEFELYIDMFAPAALRPHLSTEHNKKPIYPQAEIASDSEYFSEMAMEYRWLYYARPNATSYFPLVFSCSVRSCRSESYERTVQEVLARAAAKDANPANDQ